MSFTPIQSSVSATQPVTGPLSTETKSAAAAATTGSSATAGVNNLGSTFLQLLTQELQNQDPTAPMDSTQMVGQMISLNQLEQLASINQTLSKNASASNPASNANPNAVAATQAALHSASVVSAGISGL